MTDKTIINGVDVSRCEFYEIPRDIKDAVCEEAHTFVSKCINSKNAVYLLTKWLKRECKKQIAQGK